MAIGQKKQQQQRASAALAALLGTADPAEQLERAQRLVQAAQTPALTLVISYDARRERPVTIASPDGLTLDQCLQLMEAARQELLARERTALLARVAEQNTHELEAPPIDETPNPDEAGAVLAPSYEEA